ncbi:hypothetical protein ACHMW6_28310 [Pseudoduganella sp. UC29_106]|uniref:hypothetical protein n=1 Tax=Pseudoduganella sp. UC29_106 TaxID=3374553 RepID=UPI0037576B6F
MFKKLFGAKKSAPAAAYGKEELNIVYAMLFCDDLPQGGKDLFGEQPDVRVVTAIAQDANEESRLRLLAARWLRANGHPAPASTILGVVVEVPLEGGLDTLAAYTDGRVRYINHTGRLAVYEGAPEDVAQQARLLVAAAIPAAARATPTTQRGARPPAGTVRFSYLSTEGLRVREGGFGDLARDPLAASVLENAQQLLDLIVKQSNAQ